MIAVLDHPLVTPEKAFWKQGRWKAPPIDPDYQRPRPPPPPPPFLRGPPEPRPPPPPPPPVLGRASFTTSARPCNSAPLSCEIALCASFPSVISTNAKPRG